LLAFELGERVWKLGFTTGLGQRPRLRQIPARATDRILEEIARAKVRFRLPTTTPVVSCYEAGREAFWLHRWLVAHGVSNHVIDSSSIEVNPGGTMICGDRLVDLDPDRLEILRKVYPAYDVAARPLDLFEADRPERFELSVRTTFAAWSVVALFNYADATIEKTLPLNRLRLPGSRGYVAFEFWSQRLAGEFDRELKVRVEPQSVALLSVHPQTGIPRVVSTDRHFTQGALELKDVAWDSLSNTLSGTSLGPPGSAHNISVYVPQQYRWDNERPEYFQEHGQYSLRQIGSDILRVRARFDRDATTKWHVKFARVS
jgi:hypothetical protein